MQYHFIGSEHAILPRSHGNARGSYPYVRTMPSTLENLANVATELTPKPTVHVVSSQAGGVTGATSAGSLPRNERQVKDIRRKMTARSKDPLVSVMVMCKESMKDFVRAVTGAPDYMIVLSFDRTLDNLIRFCTNPKLPSVLTFDPTFNLGRFDVTVTTYQHPLLVFRNPKEHTSQHPNLIGPLLIHQRKQFSNYHYFNSVIVGIRQGLRNLTAFGTDGEMALVQACHSQFPYAIHLRCWLHFKDNLKYKLEHDLQLPRHLAQEFIADILGRASNLETGLVDADDEETYTAQLTSLQTVWNEREQQFTEKDPTFYEWFLKNSSEVVKKTMLRSVRQSAGLGLPPSPYYTNAVESINSLLKLRAKHKKQDLVTFITQVKEIISSQFTDVDRALAGLGDYKVADEYQKFQYSAARWCAMSEPQRKRIVTQFMSVKPVGVVREGSSSLEEESVDEEQPLPNPLTCLDVTDYFAETIWKNANDLLRGDNCIVCAPGGGTQSWLVAKSCNSTAKPHFVSMQKGHYECESDCVYYHTSKVCAHIVAVAKKNEDLEKFIAWHKKQLHGVNVTSLAESGLAKSSIGKKASKRKGVSKAKSAKISKVIANASEHSWKPRVAANPVTPASANSQTASPTTTPSTSGSEMQYGYATPMGSPSSLLPVQAVPSTQLYSQVSAGRSVLPTTPSPAAQNFHVPSQQMNPFILTFIQGNISVCFGCKQRYRKPANPPDNLCIMHGEWRTFALPGSPIPQSRFGNAYYHPHLMCVRSLWPQFDPQRDLVISNDMFAALLPSHKSIINATLGLRL